MKPIGWINQSFLDFTVTFIIPRLSEENETNKWNELKLTLEIFHHLEYRNNKIRNSSRKHNPKSAKNEMPLVVRSLTTSRLRCIYSYFNILHFQRITSLLRYNVRRISSGTVAIFHSNVKRSIFIPGYKFLLYMQMRNFKLSLVAWVSTRKHLSAVKSAFCCCLHHMSIVALNVILTFITIYLLLFRFWLTHLVCYFY